jgi:hypothetical protein
MFAISSKTFRLESHPKPNQTENSTRLNHHQSLNKLIKTATKNSHQHETHPQFKNYDTPEALLRSP